MGRPLIKLAAMIEGQWRRRLKVAYLVSMPKSAEKLTTWFFSLLKAATREKIKFVATAQEMLVELERLGCDEETMRNCQEAMTNRRRKSGPRKWFPLVDHFFFKERLADLNLDENV